MNTERIYLILESLIFQHSYGIFIMEVKIIDTRHKMLISNKFNPNKDLIYNKDGLLEYSKECPEKLKKELYEYFTMRREDE